ncbi:hypothetical protein Tco_0601238 [Tanacetum coccineum]
MLKTVAVDFEIRTIGMRQLEVHKDKIAVIVKVRQRDLSFPEKILIENYRISRKACSRSSAKFIELKLSYDRPAVLNRSWHA